MASPTGIQTIPGEGSDPFVEADEVGGVGSNYWRQRVTPMPIGADAYPPTNFTAGTASGIAVSANPNRTGLIVTNLSKNVISIGIATDAIINNGITLIAYGSAWVMGPQDYSNSDIYLIASANGSLVAIQEFSL